MLPETTIKALGLMSSCTEESLARFSYHDLINWSTVGGMQLLDEWVREPSDDPKTINSRSELVGVLAQENQLRRALRSKETGLNTVDLMLLRLMITTNTLKMKDIVSLHNICYKNLPGILNTLDNIAEVGHKAIIHDTYIVALEKYLGQFTNFKNLVESILDIDEDGEAKVRPFLSQPLQFCHTEIQRLEGKMHQEVERISKCLNVPVDDGLNSFASSSTVGVKTDFDDGWTLVLPWEKRDDIKENDDCQLLYGSTFTTRKLKAMSDLWCRLKRSYDEFEDQAVQEIKTLIRGYDRNIGELKALISHLDVITSLGEASARGPRRPFKISDLQ